MIGSTHFRRQLALRLIGAAAVTIPLGSLAEAGCSNTVSVGGAGGSGGSPNYCFAWPEPSATTATTSSTVSGTGSTSSSTSAATSGGATTSVTSGGAIPPCPSSAEADTRFCNVGCGSRYVVGEATFANGQCCYATEVHGPLSGRPFLVEDASLVAPVRWGDAAWTLPSFEASTRGPQVLPSIQDLPTNERNARAEAWARDGLLEHASIASFGRFALALMAVGAPPELIEAAHHAALDEARHARLCFGLASAYADAPLSPHAFPFGGRIEIESDLGQIAVRTVKEGCVGETLAALIAAEEHERETDPAVRAVLAIIAEDEARHAELAWRTVAWAIRVGGEGARAVVANAFEGILRDGNNRPHPDMSREPVAGRLSDFDKAELVARAKVEVLWPAVRALIASPAHGEVNDRGSALGTPSATSFDCPRS